MKFSVLPMHAWLTLSAFIGQRKGRDSRPSRLAIPDERQVVKLNVLFGSLFWNWFNVQG